MDTNTVSPGRTVTAPVCGMEIDAASAAGTSEHGGERYYFCSASCKKAFDRSPEEYSGHARKATSQGGSHHGAHSCCASTPKAKTTAKDPVCGMDVEPDSAVGSAAFAGRAYHFCSKGCLEKFRADPADVLERDPGGMARARDEVEPPSGTLYTCPMHPEVIQEGPGSCPICGMALEPLVPTSDEGPDPELIDMTRRFRVSAALTVPLLVLAMGEMVLGRPLFSRVAKPH